VAILATLLIVIAACSPAGDDDPETTGEGTDATGAPADEAGEPADGDTDEAEDAVEDHTDDGDAEAGGEADFTRLEGVTTAGDFEDFGVGGLERWEEDVPGIDEVSITSTADGAEQPALWLAPDDDEGPQPLLVVLHSWSTPYDQHLGIPFARWADERGWAMIHPDFRGVNEQPEATGSPLAVQDVIDAIDWAEERVDIDVDTVYIVGFSGGGMMSLLMAGQHPDRFAGAVAWVPIHDLVEWYDHNTDITPAPPYVEQIAASCGGPPTTDPDAREDCLQRSPVTYLDAAREAGLPVYIGAGLDDDIVPPDEALRSFNQLANEEDRLSAEALDAAADNKLPGDLDGQIETETFFGDEDPEVLFARSSGPVTLVVFDAGHEMVYNPSLEWMVRGAPADR
jgi:dienelactone hydrolase